MREPRCGGEGIADVMRDEVTTEIAATPEKVWSLVADVTRRTASVPGKSGIPTNTTNTSQVGTGQLGPDTPGMSGMHTCMP